jgi:hypothetical protein
LEQHMKPHWRLLEQYLHNLEDVLTDLTPLAKQAVVSSSAAASNSKSNTLIVMVCNQGQSVLLHNFVCAAKARNLDVSQVLVFATDPETQTLATSLGLVSYYDERNFGSNIPSEEAKRYADKTFGALMYAKVVCVQVCLTLGYNVLFQDVDIVWYRHPLELFESESSESGSDYSVENQQEFDVLFQDDGARSLRYAPYSANSGFYYIRHNPKTLYIFTSLLYNADLIVATKSHQQALNALLTEYSSLYGLRVKTLSADLLPGGSHYHRQTEYMRQLLIPGYSTSDSGNGSNHQNNAPIAHAKKPDPWLFHMSWTKNKDDKLRFMKQMGLWYLLQDSNEEDADACGIEALDCCSSEPVVSCHYRDKPSVVDCSDSPPIDQNGNKVFWPQTK